MFATLPAAPLGAVFPSASAGGGIAAGALDITGASAGAVRVSGAGAGTMALTGQAGVVQGKVSRGSLVGWGALSSGALSEMSQNSTGFAALSGAAAGTFALTGASIAVAPIRGRAPDVVVADFVVVPGNASATITKYPPVPTAPAWNISTFTGGFLIIDYPTYQAGVASVPFLNITGSATGVLPKLATASGTLDLGGIDGEVFGGVRVTATAAGSLPLSGAAVGRVRVAAASAGTFAITGSARVGIGTLAIYGDGFGTFDITGLAAGNPVISAQSSGLFAITGQAGVATAIFGSAAGELALTGFSGRRVSFQGRWEYPENSKNSVRILS